MIPIDRGQRCDDGGRQSPVGRFHEVMPLGLRQAPDSLALIFSRAVYLQGEERPVDACEVRPLLLVWRFRSPHHSCGEPDCGLLNQSHNRIIGLLVSFDSEIRK